MHTEIFFGPAHIGKIEYGIDYNAHNIPTLYLKVIIQYPEGHPNPKRSLLFYGLGSKDDLVRALLILSIKKTAGINERLLGLAGYSALIGDENFFASQRSNAEEYEFFKPFSEYDIWSLIKGCQYHELLSR